MISLAEYIKTFYVNRHYEKALSKWMAHTEKTFMKNYGNPGKDSQGHETLFYQCALCPNIRSEILITLVKSDPIVKQIGKKKIKLIRHIFAICPSCTTQLRKENRSNVRDVASYIANEKRKRREAERVAQSDKEDLNVFPKGVN